MLALLQFDASSIPVIERMLASGRLPALAELKRRGGWDRLKRSTPLFVEAGSYVSLYSAREVGDHGIYSAFLWSAQHQKLRFMDRSPTPLAAWDHLSSAGHGSLVIDPYESWPATETDGLWLLNGWQSRHKLLLRISRPRGAQSALSLRYGRAPVIEHLYGRQSAARLLSRRARALKASGRSVRAVERLIHRGQDLIWITFSAAHFAGHYFWDPVAAIEGEVGSEDRRALESTLEDAYESVDAAIGSILELLPDGADVIAFSPIGMGPEMTRSDLLPDMLRAVLGGQRSDTDGDGAGSLIWKLRASLPLNLRLALARPLPASAVRRITSDLNLRGTDWARTRAFALPGDHHGYIRLNLRGRERDGIVDPADAEGLLDEIADGLLSFAEPDGASAVARVHRVGDAVSGERAGSLPDLVVEWPDRPSLGLAGVGSPRFGDVVRRDVGSGRTGNHNTDAWAIIAPGESSRRDLGRPPRITDVATTAVELLGGDPRGLAGESLLAR